MLPALFSFVFRGVESFSTKTGVSVWTRLFDCSASEHTELSVLFCQTLRQLFEVVLIIELNLEYPAVSVPVSYTHLTLPTT